MSALYIILSMLAVWRATYMLQNENGPFGIFARLQAWIAKKPDKPGSLNDGFFCFYCLSVWVSIIPAAFLAYNIQTFLLYLLSISAGAILIYEISEKIKQ